MSSPGLLFMFHLPSTSFIGQEKEGWKIYPQEHCGAETLVLLPEHSQTLPLSSCVQLLGSGNIHPQTAGDPSSPAGKGKRVWPDPTLLNIKHTHFLFTIPQTMAPPPAQM